jgi:4-amino-4-deoxy-L-arabinose transferase-like glycosyltransferase
MTRALAVGAAALALSAALVLYAHRLDAVPAYLGLDEFHFAVHAHSLATTGRDLNGSRLPLFISLEDPLGDRPVLAWGTTWYHPVGFYVLAATLTALPLNEWTVRLPFVFIGLLDIVLMYFAARHWFNDRRIGIAAAAMLAMAPAHFILSRVALDYLLPLPFTLAWLWSLAVLMQRAERRIALVTGLILGAGCYSYVTSWLMMPIYLAVTVAVCIAAKRRDAIAPLLGGFILPVLMLLPWCVWHPEMPANIFMQYQAGESRQSVLTAIVTGRDIRGALRDALATYWNYFNPSFLFVTGGSSRLVSTGLAGVWPIGVAALLLLTLARMVGRKPPIALLVLSAGLLTAPLPAALKGEPFAIQRAIGLLPFVVLLAAGALATLNERSWRVKGVIVLALLSIPLQFQGFVTDYFGEYRLRSAGVFDATAFKTTADQLLTMAADDPPPMIAMTAPLYDVSAKWRFYATKANQIHWLERTRYFSGSIEGLGGAPAGSLAVIETVALESHPIPAGWVLAAAPESVTGTRPLTILRRE